MIKKKFFLITPQYVRKNMMKLYQALFIASLLVLLYLEQPIHRVHAAASSQSHDTTPQKGLEVTSDKLDYCLKLDRALTRKLLHPHSVPVGIMEDATLLQRRGLELCNQGHVRGGIERLRRGLVLLKTYRKSENSPQTIK